MTKEQQAVERLKMMRKPFDENQICKLPKPTKAQTDAVKKDYRKGARCNLCGGWHHPGVVHLDYVGHAALTDRLLEVDLMWDWEPVATDKNGAPVIDGDGGMWIFLTVCGVTRRGYGDAGGKTGSNAMKERIGDALRNAAMRFGAALDLWHKGELHAGYEQDEEIKDKKPEFIPLEKIEEGLDWFNVNRKTVEQLDNWFESKAADVAAMNEVDQKKAKGFHKDTREMMLEETSDNKLEMKV